MYPVRMMARTASVPNQSTMVMDSFHSARFAGEIVRKVMLLSFSSLGAGELRETKTMVRMLSRVSQPQA
jgi:hypothetical protein